VLLKYFSENPDVGLLFPMNFIPIQKYLESDINQWNMEYLAKRIGLRAGAPREIICPAGSMFWAKTKALCNLSDVELSYSEFDNEAGQLDGTLAHAFERLFVYIAKDNGFSSRVIGSTLN
jgi:lipopolysaccharide biosynthesis protein